MQTFNKNIDVNFKCISVSCRIIKCDLLQTLTNLAVLISDKVIQIKQRTKKNLHLAAVISCNCYCALPLQKCVKKKVSFDIMLPLILETAQKINIHHPLAQTGPAKRGI